MRKSSGNAPVENTTQLLSVNGGGDKNSVCISLRRMKGEGMRMMACHCKEGRNKEGPSPFTTFSVTFHTQFCKMLSDL